MKPSVPAATRKCGAEGYIDEGGTPHLNVLDLQMQIRRLPPVVAMVAGFAIGGGHVLHLVCDLSIAAENARFGQTGPASAVSTPAWGRPSTRTIGLKRAKNLAPLPPVRRRHCP